MAVLLLPAYWEARLGHGDLVVVAREMQRGEAGRARASIDELRRGEVQDGPGQSLSRITYMTHLPEAYHNQQNNIPITYRQHTKS